MFRSVGLALLLIAANLWLARFAGNRYEPFVRSATDAHFGDLLADLRNQDEKDLNDALSRLSHPHAPDLPRDMLSREITPDEEFLLGADEAQDYFRSPEDSKLDRFWLIWFDENDLADARAIKASWAGWDARLEKAKSIYPRGEPAVRQKYFRDHRLKQNCVVAIAGLMEARQQFVHSFYEYWTHTVTPPPPGGVAKAAKELKQAAAEYDRAITEALNLPGCHFPPPDHTRVLTLSGDSKPPLFEPDAERRVVQLVINTVDRCGDIFDHLEASVRQRARETLEGERFPVRLRLWRKFARLTDQVCTGE
jgi:hypothetical protein